MLYNFCLKSFPKTLLVMLYNNNHIFIQNEGSNNTEEATSTSDEEAEEDSSYTQSSKETERDDATIQNTTANSESQKIPCYRCGREGHIAPKCTYSTNINGIKALTPAASKSKYPNHMSLPNGMIGNWDDQVDEEGYDCLFVQHQQKLPSIVNKTKPKTKKKKESIVKFSEKERT